MIQKMPGWYISLIGERRVMRHLKQIEAGKEVENMLPLLDELIKEGHAISMLDCAERPPGWKAIHTTDVNDPEDRADMEAVARKYKLDLHIMPAWGGNGEPN